MHQKFLQTPSAARVVKENAGPGWQKRILFFFGLLIGVAIGFIFEKGKIYLPAVIKGQMVFSDFSMMKMFLAGTSAGMFSIALLLQIKLQSRAATKLALGFEVLRGYGANVVGGLIMGIGINVAGACPGTMLAQIGAGVPRAFFTLVGGLAGALSFALLHSMLQGTKFHFKEDAVLVDEYFGIHIYKLSVLFAVIVACVVLILDHFFPWSSTITGHVICNRPASWFLDPYACAWSPIKAGVLMGVMQIPTFFFLDQNIAVSSSFVMVVGGFLRLIVPDAPNKMPYLKNFVGVNDFGQLGSSLGIIFGSFLSLWLSDVSIIHDRTGSIVSSFVGGFLVLFGARLGGGCASGHGLSGIARLSSASLLTSLFMFVGAIGSGVLTMQLR